MREKHTVKIKRIRTQKFAVITLKDADNLCRPRQTAPEGFVLFDLWFYVSVNNYGHVEMVN